jgi:hypothetical protein
MRPSTSVGATPSALARNCSHESTIGSSIFGAPWNITTCFRSGRSFRRASIFFHCSAFSQNANGASEWWTMYCTSSGEHVV